MESLSLKELEDKLAASEARLKRLELDAAEERAAIDAVKQSKQQHAPSGLLDSLPQELRDKIWGYCVAPGKVFFTKSNDSSDIRFKDFSEYDMPHLSLLAVSKSIRNQAAIVLFEQNQFIFTNVSTLGRGNFLFDEPYDNYDGMKLSGDSDDKCRHFGGVTVSLSRLARTDLRSTSIAFDARSERMDNALYNAGLLRDSTGATLAPGRWSRLSSHQKVSYAHDQAIRPKYFTALCLLDVLLLECHSLKTLELDFTNSYCQLGCCRVVSTLTDIIARDEHEWPDRVSVSVLGTKNQQERDAFVNVVRTGSQKTGTVTKVVFRKFEIRKPLAFGVVLSLDTPYDRLAEDDLDKKLEEEEVRVHKKMTNQ